MAAAGVVVDRRVLVWLAIACLLGGGPARASSVLLLDASASSGDATRILDDAVELLARQHHVSALGPAFADGPRIAVDAAAGESPVRWLVERAQREFESFQLETAQQTLAEAGDALAGQPGGEQGALLLEMHWLYAQLAMVRGEDAVAVSHLARIAVLAPWWEPPVGYLTPELREQWLAERERVVGQGARIDLGQLPPGVEAWVDGFALPAGQARALAAGRHLVRVERAGFVPERRWIELQPGQRWLAVGPSRADWEDATRAMLRGCLDGELPAEAADVLAALGTRAAAELVVVGYRSATDPPGTVRAAAVVPGQRSWVIAHRSCSAYDLAEIVARTVRADEVAGASPVSPLMTVELGGALRMLGPAERNVSGGGGPALELGGGIDLAGRLELRAVVGLAFAGPVALEVADARQRAYLVRAGGVVAPRIPLGRGAALFVGGGGGFLLSGIVTTADDGVPYPAEGRGGFAIATVGLDLPAGRAATFGPAISYLHGVVPLQRGVPVAGQGSLEVQAAATRSLQFQLRIRLSPTGL